MHTVLRSVAWAAPLLTLAIAWTHPAIAADVTVALDAGDGFVVDGAGPTGRLRVDGDTGNISRNGALFVHTTGTNNNNTFVGESAGNTGTTGPGSNSSIPTRRRSSARPNSLLARSRLYG